jgi:hydroxymethylpyrimidine/phosphomethylpyrimidine kinase
MLPRALSIAGSDSSGGAGIQADLKTFTVLRVYGMTAITAVTAQNTLGVEGVHPLPASFVRRQIDSVISDIGIDAAKTGMLFSVDTVIAVAGAARDHALAHLVVDPVLVAGSGASLAAGDLPRALLAELIPRALLVTPNAPEAEALTGIQIASVADMAAAGKRIVAAGAQACLVKGGHLHGPAATDVLVAAGAVHELVGTRLATRHTHGTGCQLSAAITAFLAHGMSLRAAVEKGKAFVSAAIAAGLALGHGQGPANPLGWQRDD